MKIAFIIYGDLDRITGGYIYDKHLVEYLTRSNHNIDVISLPDTWYLKSVEHNFQKKFYNTLAAQQYDIILQDELCHPSLFRMNRSIRSEFQNPIITIVHALKTGLHQNFFTKFLIKSIESSYLQTVDGFIFISQYTKEETNALTTIDAPWIIAYPAGDRLPGQTTPEEIIKKIPAGVPLNLLYLGAITENKQLHRILETLSRFPAGEFQISVAGKFNCSKRYEKKIRRLARQAGKMHSVKFLGEITDKTALANLFKTHHLLTLPSLSEGLPLVILEAASFGVPSITTQRSAAGEFIQNNKNGVLIDPEDQSAIYDTLSHLNANRELLSDMSRNVYRSFENHPTWDQTGEKIEKFLSTYTESVQ
ncbi:MAG: glycosyltransferase [Candidatus Marinimicrobia bacterium]|nr:glycosyltransferase [Candidatus Neomarinimicrobiota bacterium]